MSDRINAFYQVVKIYEASLIVAAFDDTNARYMK